MFDKEYTFTYWVTRYAIEGVVVSLPWSHWVDELSSPKATKKPKSSLPGLVFARMVPNDRRTNKNVLSLGALVLDVECPDDMPQGTYRRRLEHALVCVADLEYVAYTSYSHREDAPRLRLVFPLKDEVAPSQYRTGMSYLNCLTGSLADVRAQKPSQPAYLPFHPEGSKDAWAVHHPGAFLDLDNPLVEEVTELRATLGEGHGRAPSEASTRLACKHVLAGLAYAEDGNRDDMATRITWHLARRHPQPTLAAIELVFHWPCWTMGTDAPSEENIHSKILRGSEKRIEEKKEQAAAAYQGDPLIVQHLKNYYVLQLQGGYTRRMWKEEMFFVVRKHLAPRDEVVLTYQNDRGAVKQKPVQSLVHEYGDLAKDVVIDLTASEAYFRDNIIYEAPIHWPELEPRFDPQIDKWLSLLGGEKLKDWLSILADLNRLSSALVIMGPRNIGKTLLAMGCAARFGSQAPAQQHSLTGRFQEELSRCPLIYIDEDVQDNPYDRSFLAAIRSELSIKERNINRKYREPVQMLGALRCIISANHLPFKQKDAQTGQDLEAIAERFYWINAHAEPAIYLRGIEPDVLQLWRDELLARHIVHLENTRRISKANRFGVSGDSEKLADLINIGVRLNSWVTEWICNGVLDGFRKLEHGDPDVASGAVLHENNVYVRVKAIVKAWDRYLPNNATAPDTRPISEALRGIADPEGPYRPYQIGIEGNNQLRYYRVRLNPLITFLEQTGTGTSEEFMTALERGNLKVGA